MVKKMGQNPFEQKHKIDQLFKQRECLPKALPKIARCLKISRIILSYPLADCFEFRACLASRYLCSKNINEYSNKPAKGY